MHSEVQVALIDPKDIVMLLVAHPTHGSELVLEYEPEMAAGTCDTSWTGAGGAA